jgi:hypothetical protein
MQVRITGTAVTRLGTRPAATTASGTHAFPSNLFHSSFSIRVALPKSQSDTTAGTLLHDVSATVRLPRPFLRSWQLRLPENHAQESGQDPHHQLTFSCSTISHTSNGKYYLCRLQGPMLLLLPLNTLPLYPCSTSSAVILRVPRYAKPADRIHFLQI